MQKQHYFRASMSMFLSGILLLNSCTVGNTVVSNGYANRENVCTEDIHHVYEFYDFEKIDFDYKKIGVVEVLGSEDSSTPELLAHLKEKAYQQCANGIIGIQTSREQRHTANFFEAVSDNDDDPYNYYMATRMEAIAVAIDQDSTFYEKYGRRKDLSFLDTVYGTRKTEQKEHKREVNTTVFTAFILAFVGIVAVVASKDDANDNTN